jgi:hypothetical protein
MARIGVFEHDSNPQRSSPDYYVSKSTKKSMLKHGRAVELENGTLQLKPPFRNSLLRERLVVYRDVMYILPHMEHSAMNRGSEEIHYPIPFAFEGRFGAGGVFGARSE